MAKSTPFLFSVGACDTILVSKIYRKVGKSLSSMRQNFLKYGFSAALFALALVPLMAAAQGGAPSSLPTIGTTPTGLIGILCGLANWMFTFLVVLAVIFVIYAAFKYLTAGGEPENVGKASSMLIYAAVAIAVAILAKGFPLLIGNLMGAGFSAGCQ